MGAEDIRACIRAIEDATGAKWNWEHYFECMRRFNQETDLELQKWEINRSSRPKLDTVSNHLKLPKFNHHRASDDAAVVARIMEKFIPMMQDRGIRDLNGINRLCEDNARAEKTFHMILLVKNRTGLKNLYKLISSSYLEHFYRTPNIPRSLPPAGAMISIN